MLICSPADSKRVDPAKTTWGEIMGGGKKKGNTRLPSPGGGTTVVFKKTVAEKGEVAGEGKRMLASLF